MNLCSLPLCVAACRFCARHSLQGGQWAIQGIQMHLTPAVLVVAIQAAVQKFVEKIVTMMRSEGLFEWQAVQLSWLRWRTCLSQWSLSGAMASSRTQTSWQDGCCDQHWRTACHG